MPVDAALPSGVNFGPAERAQMVKQSLDICQKKGVIGSGYIPKTHQTTCTANSKGLFAYYQYAEAGFILTCRTKDGGGSGWAGLTGIKDISLIDAAQLTEVAADKALKSQKPRAIEPGRYTTILEPRANARFLSLMTGPLQRAHGGGPGRQLLQRQAAGHDEGRREAVQRRVHAQERHRQPDPAPDADRHRRHGGAGR